MRRLTIFVVLLSATALAFIMMRTSAQSPQNPQIPTPDYPFPGYPEEFSPMKTWRPGKPQLTEPTSKFLKAVKPVPNRYIVKLKDDVVPRNNSIESKRDQISEIARSHAAAHRGEVRHIYAAVLTGFSIELPNEAAARAISNNPNVQWVSEVELLKTTQEEGGGDGYNFDGDIEPNGLESDPPWGLDAIDGTLPQPAPDINGQSTAGPNPVYLYNATGAGVVAYVLDTGIYNQHQEFIDFSSRASQLADCFTYVNCHNGQQTGYFNQQHCVFPMPNSNNNDCQGHGTQVAGIIGGRLTGVAKQVTIKSVKVCGKKDFGCPTDAIIAGADLVTSDHLANWWIPAVANFSLGGPLSPAIDQAVSDTIQSGVTCVFSAGNDNALALGQSPAHIPQGLTVGGVDWTGSRYVPSLFEGSNFGPPVDMYAPGARIVSAQSGHEICSIWGGTNHEFCVAAGATSFAAPFVSGLVATYLQGRTGTDQCIFYPVQGPAPPCCGNPSVCPDRVTRFIDANALQNKLSNISVTFYDNGIPIVITSPNRFPLNLAVPGPVNPVDNQRFFVWQQYADYIPTHYLLGTPQPEPDEGGLDFWTGQITGHCGSGPNDNNPCTELWRVLTSRAFFVATHPSWFNSSYGLNVSNEQFIAEVYRIYLRREADGPGFGYWVGQLNTYYGSPANEGGVFNTIKAFVAASDYRYRFGPP